MNSEQQLDDARRIKRESDAAKLDAHRDMVREGSIEFRSRRLAADGLHDDMLDLLYRMATTADATQREQAYRDALLPLAKLHDMATKGGAK